MSIIVDKNKIFQHDLFGEYNLDDKSKFKKFKVNKNGNTKLTIYYTDRDFDSMSKIIEDCSIINSVNGKPLLRASSFIRQIFSTYIKKIHIKSDIEDNEILITPEIVSKIHYDFVKLISKTWLEITHRT